MNDLQDRLHLILYEATIDGLIGVGAARKTYILVLPPSVASLREHRGRRGGPASWPSTQAVRITRPLSAGGAASRVDVRFVSADQALERALRRPGLVRLAEAAGSNPFPSRLEVSVAGPL